MVTRTAERCFSLVVRPRVETPRWQRTIPTENSYLYQTDEHLVSGNGHDASVLRSPDAGQVWQTGSGRPLGGKAQSQPRDAAGAGPGPGDRCASTSSTAKLPTLLMLVQCHRCMWKWKKTWVLIEGI